MLYNILFYLLQKNKVIQLKVFITC